MIVMPPWPHENYVESVDQATNPFRARHGLVGKFVIMYSGNHSPSNPLSTLLGAAIQLRDDADLRFLFVGGGLGKKEVEAVIGEHKLRNALSPHIGLRPSVFGLRSSAFDILSAFGLSHLAFPLQ